MWVSEVKTKKGRAISRKIAKIQSDKLKVVFNPHGKLGEDLRRVEKRSLQLARERIIKKIDSKKIQNRLEDIGQSIHNYIEHVRFNYTYSKIINSKTGSLSINNLPIKHGGLVMTKAEENIVKNEFIPYLKENFPGIKSLDAKVISEYYITFMENNYGLIKFIGRNDSYENVLNHDAFYQDLDNGMDGIDYIPKELQPPILMAVEKYMAVAKKVSEA